jgi:RNA polymerase sigma factor (sigma-70 family)
MSFPQTSQTLIRRITAQGNERDWHQFLNDYWLPVCRFAQQRGSLTLDDAEDVASETFEAVLRNQLLCRWASNRSAKLRTLLCTVVRHVLGNRARVHKGRQQLLRENAHELVGRADLPTLKGPEDSAENADHFYAAWVEGMLFAAVETLMLEYHQTGKGDYFRVLYGRICEQMTTPQISETLGLTTTTSENYFKAARKRLAAKLEELVRRHVERYSEPDDMEADFIAEWNQIGQHLKERGGLEQIISSVYENLDPAEAAQRQTQAITAALGLISPQNA